MRLRTTLSLWALYTFVSACGFIIVWVALREKLQTAKTAFLVKFMLPLSLAVCVLEEMVYVAILPLVVTPYVHRTYWHRLEYVMTGEFVTNMAFLWISIFIARGVGYYERYRQKEIKASRLETELVSAQLRALRMQLNPHFLFNTMNGISCLIRVNADAADLMLEQLSRLLRMTLDRGDVQRVPLREEIEFVQLYLAIQQSRFGERVQYELDIAPATLDAMVPVMILQPIVENAYQHGIAPSQEAGMIRVEARTLGNQLMIRILNTGPSVLTSETASSGKPGIGISNVKARLQLHYQAKQDFSLTRLHNGLTEARLTLPMEVEDSKPLAAAQQLEGCCHDECCYHRR